MSPFGPVDGMCVPVRRHGVTGSEAAVEAWVIVKHYVRVNLLRVFGPAQLDDNHDPIRIENRSYAVHRNRRRAGHR